jgi:hypothetical protein
MTLQLAAFSRSSFPTIGRWTRGILSIGITLALTQIRSNFCFLSPPTETSSKLVEEEKMRGKKLHCQK